MTEATRLLLDIDTALRVRAYAFEQHGEDSPQYVAADGRLIDAKEKLNDLRERQRNASVDKA